MRSAFADRSDRFVQGFIGAHVDGVPVEGVLFAGTIVDHDPTKWRIVPTSELIPR